MQVLTRSQRRLYPIVKHHLVPSRPAFDPPLPTGSYQNPALPKPAAVSFLNINFPARFFSRKSGRNHFAKRVSASVTLAAEKEDENEEDDAVKTYDPQPLQVRWGFIKKVYGTVATQLSVTAAVSSAAVLYTPFNEFLISFSNPALFCGLTVPAFISMWFLYVNQREYPKNIISFGAFTLFQSLTIGACCAHVDGKTVLEALALTSAAVSSLTGYTFWAAKRGKDFSFLGPILAPPVTILALVTVAHMFFPSIVPIGLPYCAIGATIFSGYIVYDTDNLLKRYDDDEYLWASVNLYLDVLQLFRHIMMILDMLKERK